MMSRLREASDSNYDAWEIVEGTISKILEKGLYKGELYVGRRHRGAGRLCGVAAIRRSSGTCPRPLQERPAGHIGMCGRRAPGRGNATARRPGGGAGAIPREQRHWRAPPVARPGDGFEWRSLHHEYQA